MILSFLGPRPYDETIYYFNDKNNCYKTDLVQIAISKIFKDNEMIIFVTKEAKESDNFKKLCENIDNLKVVDIKAPKSEKDIWKLFEEIIESVDEGEEIIFDITHSFRMQPFIGFLVLLFLREIKNVKIKGVYYGAYEAKDENNYTPIIDLTPMIDLAEWIYAVKNLKKYGRADAIKDILERTPGKKLGNTLYMISKSIYYNQLAITFWKSNELSKKEKILDNILPKIKPIKYIKDDVLEFKKFNVKDFINRKDNSISHPLDSNILEKSLELAKYQKEKQLIPQFFQSIREWIIDVMLYNLGKYNDYFIKNWVEYAPSRKLVEIYLNSGKLSNIKIGRDEEEEENYKRKLENYNINLLDVEEKCNELTTYLKNNGVDIFSIWDDIADMRNILSHAGRKKQVILPEVFEEKSDDILQKCEEILKLIKNLENNER